MIHTKTTGDDSSGRVFPIPERDGMGVTLYNNTSADISKGDVLQWVTAYNSTKKYRNQAKTPATSTNITTQVVVAIEDITDGDIGKFQWSGYVDAYVTDAGTLSTGRALEVLNNENELKDAGQDGLVNLAEGAAELCEAYTSSDSGNTLKEVQLLGGRCQIASG